MSLKWGINTKEIINKTWLIDSCVKTEAKLLASLTVSYSMNADSNKMVVSPKEFTGISELLIHYINPTQNKYPPSVAYSLKK